MEEVSVAPRQMRVIWNTEYRLYWRPKRAGYSSSLLDAGLYSEAEARSIERIRGTDKPMTVAEAIAQETKGSPTAGTVGERLPASLIGADLTLSLYRELAERDLRQAVTCG